MPFARLKAAVQTLRFRLTAWVAAVVFLVVCVTMLAVRISVVRTIETEFNQRLVQDMVDVRLAITQYYPKQEPLFKDLITRRGLAHLHVDWFVQLFDNEGHEVWSSPNARPLPPPKMLPLEGKPHDAGDVRYVDSKIDDAPVGSLIIRVGSTRLSMDDDIALLNWIMLLASVSILVLAPVSGYLLASRATKPLARIISTTSRLQPKKLDERLPIRGTGDELDQLSATINSMLDRIGTYIDSNRDFIANAAHELRSPLTAIRGSVDVALDRLRTPDEYAALLTDVAEECARLTSLVNRLLLLAEGDAGRLAARDQFAQLDKVVRDSVDMFEAVAESKGIELKVTRIAPVMVPGEEYHLRQLVRNLLDNAIKFTPASGLVTIDLAADCSRRQTLLRVTDSGVGIAAEDLPRIFERFYRADKARSRDGSPGGSGLGLAICQSIVSALNGEIQVQSRPGEGSVFTVTLPLA